MRIVAIASSIALLVLVGCQEESTQPTVEEFQQERAALNARVEARKAKKTSAQPAAGAAAAAPLQTAAVPKGTPADEGFVGSGSGIGLRRDWAERSVPVVRVGEKGNRSPERDHGGQPARTV